jgi:hypothetical protein
VRQCANAHCSPSEFRALKSRNHASPQHHALASRDLSTVRSNHEIIASPQHHALASRIT